MKNITAGLAALALWAFGVTMPGWWVYRLADECSGALDAGSPAYVVACEQGLTTAAVLWLLVAVLLAVALLQGCGREER